MNVVSLPAVVSLPDPEFSLRLTLALAHFVWQGIIVGAHFDTVSGSPGANDNGSGTAVVLAVASILAATPCRTSPITFAFFDEEEVGLVGARAYANSLNPANFRAGFHSSPRLHADRPEIPVERVVVAAVVEDDQGAQAGEGVGVGDGAPMHRAHREVLG